ncbi:uncharacterized protein PADG_04245 [Paracoccidioides brasiliensis Pb18]|uniref:Uncharacterized protein n=1 Tax=Paracoccidioides brasiliensis (strain Pb18) TaxID=502780 RepID=C1GAF9_PARBD|nr:uncharacterized protein PADG_04245 [Paracoccidioides brasiliensis Pb18]EEH48161.2 hypothetical protein PADG_04245 [Paracoccidioides brasiliensis Pb18]
MDDCPQESEMTIDGRLGEIGRQLEEFDNDFREIETEFNNINIRFNDLDRRHDDVEGLFQEVDARFDEVNTLCDDIDNWCDRADKRFDGLEQDLRDVVAELANSKAMNANRVLRRIHQRINQVQVRTLMPLGLRQRAKGVFESAFSGDKPIETQRALQTIRDLAAFYEVVIYSDEQADGEGAGVDVTGDVDGYMEELLDKWGLDWTKVCEIVEERVLNPQTQQARIKRSASLNGVEAQVSVRRHS